MDITTYYYNSYVFPTQVPSYETIQTVNDGQLGTYEGQVSFYEEQLNSFEVEDDSYEDTSSIPLPKELTNMFKPLECELCGVSVICPASAFTHYEGKIHIKNVNAYMKEHYNVYGSLKLKKERFTPVKCDVCNIELTSKIVYQQHFSGKQHLKNLKKKQYSLPTASDVFTSSADDSLLKDLPPPPPPPKLSDFVCEICNISTNTEQQLSFHKNGQKHKKKLSKLKESNLDIAINAFYNNEWPEGSENGIFPENGADDSAASFIENPEMDFPLQFNEFTVESGNEAAQNVDNDEIELENKVDENSAPGISESNVAILPTSLEEKTSEVPVDLGIKDEKLLSSTGIFLRQLSVVTRTVINEDIHQEGDHSNNNSDVLSVSDQKSIDNLETTDSRDKKDFTSLSNTELQSSSQTFGQNVESSINSNVTNSLQDLAKTSDLMYTSEKKEDTIHIEDVRAITNTREVEITVKKSVETVAIETKDESKIHDSKLDQVLTKLALEEIEKECTNFEKNRGGNKLLPKEKVITDKEVCMTKYKYDKAGYRINEEVGNCQSINKENYNDNRKKPVSNNGSYNNNGLRNKNYSNRWNNSYDKWNNNHFKMYNKYNDYSYRYRDDKYGDYRRYNDRDYDRYRKRKRDKQYSSDEEYRSSRTSRRSSNKDHKKHRSPSKSRKRRSSSRKRRSYSSESTYTERSRSDNSDRDHKRKNKKSRKNDRRKGHDNDKKYKRDKRSRSDHSDGKSSSSRSSSSSNNHDYRLDKDGMCDKHHRCEKAYNKCPYKHKDPFKPKTVKNEKTAICRLEEETSNPWNPEPPADNEIEVITKIKIEKTDGEEGEIIEKAKVDSALSAYMTSTGTYYCKYCIVSTRSNELFREHLQTPKHALLVKFKNKI